jgi:hypothetical protein
VIFLALAAGLVAPAQEARPAEFEANHIENSGTVRFAAPAEEVFALLEPEGKRLRAGSWDVEILYPATPDARPGTVLRQVHKRAEVQQIWLVSDYEPPERIKYVIFVPDMEVWEFDMRLSSESGEETVVEVSHRITSLSERANPAVQQFADGFDSYLEAWQRSIAAMLSGRE